MLTSKPSPLMRLVGDDDKQRRVGQLLDLLSTDTWLAQHVENILNIGESFGFAQLAQEPERVMMLLQQDIEEFHHNVDFARRLSRLYPDLVGAGTTPEPPATEERVAA